MQLYKRLAVEDHISPEDTAGDGKLVDVSAYFLVLFNIFW
jgi:hypothetical protein